VAIGSGSASQKWATLPLFKVFYCHVFTTEAPRTASLSLTMVVEAIFLEEIRGEVQFHETESANTASDFRNGGFDSAE